MTSLHRSRLAAVGLGLLTIMVALFTGGTGSPGGGVAIAPGRGAGDPVADGGRAGPPPGHFRRRNPFGLLRQRPPPEATAPAVPPPAPTGPPPVAGPRAPAFPLVLVGTVAAGPFGMAILRAATSTQEHVLGPGADLGDVLGEAWRGWRLIEVGRKAVRFRRGDELHALEMEEPVLAALPPRAPPGPAPPPAPPPTGAAQETREVDRQELDRVSRNLPFLVTQLSVQPYFERGQPAGIRVARIRPGSFFARMGIQNGDVLRGVAGEALHSLPDAVKLHRAFQGSSEVSLELLRDGEARSIVFQVR